MSRRRKPRIVSEGQPTVWIGKQGVSSLIINEISKQLDKRRTVKIRVLGAALADEKTKEIAQRVAEETKSRIVDLCGHTFTIHKLKRI